MQEVELYDSYGRELYQLTQWDKDIGITIKAPADDFTGSGSCQIHFFNALSTSAYVTTGSYTVSGSTMTVTCVIPNKILEEPFDVMGHVVMLNRGLYRFRINMIRRPRG